jgi:hypothetical protein
MDNPALPVDTPVIENRTVPLRRANGELRTRVLRAARTIPGAHRQSFFDFVAHKLRHLRYVYATDVRHACGAGIQQFGGFGVNLDVKQRRYG